MEHVEHRFEECRAAAIDLGASSGRVIMGVIEDGQSLSLYEVHRFENGLVRHGETLVWDMDKVVAQVEAGLVAAAEAGATTCAILSRCPHGGARRRLVRGRYACRRL